MLLAIDVGNTNTVFAVYDGDTLLDSWRCETVAARNADEYAVFLKQIFSLADLDWGIFGDVIISSVVPAVNRHLERFCRKYLEIEPIEVTREIAGIKIALEKPEEVGADRLVNAVAVAAHYQTPAIVIDFGTATTFDVIKQGGVYAGGVIAPGINLSLKALQAAAAKLPGISIEKPDHVIGTDTVSAMQSGIFWGYLGLIEGVVRSIGQELTGSSGEAAGPPPFVLATGGLAGLFARHTDIIQTVDSDLILKGLLLIYKGYKQQ